MSAPAPAPPRRPGLLRRHRDFRRLWAAQLVSEVGTSVSYLAVPLVAVTVLDASTFQVGLLVAAQATAFLLVGLPAGAWVDRVRRRPVLIAADLARAGLLGSVPVAAALDVLTLAQLYVVVLLMGVGTVFFDVAYQSYLPRLVGRDDLVEGNGRLEASRSVALTAGPTVGGYLVQWLTAPFALAADAASFLWSAGWIARIRHPEPPPEPARRALRQEIVEGLRFVLRHPVLRALAATGATAVIFISTQQAVLLVFLVRELGLAAGTIGLLFTAASLGTVAGAVAAPALTRRVGTRRAMLWYPVAAGAFGLLTPLADTGWRLAFVVAGGGLGSAAVVAYNIVQVSYRQSCCPDELLGRMTATLRFLMWGATPLGGVLGGVLGTQLGLRPTLWVSAVGLLLASGWLFASPLRSAGGGGQP
jgi:MFS family permease